MSNLINVDALRAVPKDWSRSFKLKGRHNNISGRFTRVKYSKQTITCFRGAGSTYNYSNCRLKNGIYETTCYCSKENCQCEIRLIDINIKDIVHEMYFSGTVEIMDEHTCSHSRTWTEYLNYTDNLIWYIRSQNYNPTALSSNMGIHVNMGFQDPKETKIIIYDHQLLAVGITDSKTTVCLKVRCQSCANLRVHIVKRDGMLCYVVGDGTQLSSCRMQICESDKIPFLEKECEKPFYLFRNAHYFGFGLVDLIPHLLNVCEIFGWIKFDILAHRNPNQTNENARDNNYLNSINYDNLTANENARDINYLNSIDYDSLMESE